MSILHHMSLNNMTRAKSQFIGRNIVIEGDDGDRVFGPGILYYVLLRSANC